MRTIDHLEKQENAEPIDDATQAILDTAEDEIKRGEFRTPAQAREIVRERYQAWQKTQQDTLPVS